MTVQQLIDELSQYDKNLKVSKQLGDFNPVWQDVKIVHREHYDNQDFIVIS